MDKRMDFITKGAKILCVALPLLSPSVFAAEWIGNTDSNWSTAANWTLNEVPDTASEIAVFNNSAATFDPTISSTTTFAGIDFQSGASGQSYTVTINSLAEIESFGIENTSGNAQTLILGPSGTLEIHGGDIGAQVTVVNDNGRTVNLFDDVGDLSQATFTMNNNSAGSLRLRETLKNDVIHVGSVSGNSARILLYGNKSVALGALNQNDLIGGTIAPSTGATGGLIKEGSGVLTLTGANFYRGPTLINEGTLQVGNGTTTAADIYYSKLVDISNGSTFIFDNSTTKNEFFDVTGTGTFIKRGLGVLVFQHPLSFDGAINVEAGQIRFDNGGKTHADIHLDSGANVVFNPSLMEMTYEGVISGEGGVMKIGNVADLILTGDNTYTGQTQVTSSRFVLQIGDGGTHGSIVSDVLLGASAQLVFNRSDTLTYAGTVSGFGDLIQRGSGTLILTADHSYTGTTRIDSGSTLQLGNQGSTGSVQGSIDNSGTLIFYHSVPITFDKPITGSGTLIKRGSESLTLTNTDALSQTRIEQGSINVGGGGATGDLRGSVFIADGASLIIDRNNDTVSSDDISGPGDVVKRGAGTAEFRGPLDYTGNTWVQEGVFKVGNIFYPITLRSPQVTVDAGAKLYFDTQGTTTYAGRITGQGGVQKSTNGRTRIILTGENDYTGLTEILNGYLQIGDGGYSGSITSDVFLTGNGSATLVFNRADDIDYAGSISGTSGRLHKYGAGTLRLTGNSFDASNIPLSIYQGAVEIDNTAGGVYLGDIRLNSENATVIIDTDAELSSPKEIGGSGYLIKRGTGNLLLLNRAILNGGTIISEGTLTVSDGVNASGTIFGPIENNAALVFNTPLDFAFGDVISGTGSLTQKGPNRLTLSANNTYSGGTVVQAGSILQVDGGIVGDVVNNGKLIFSGDADHFDGSISGQGSLVYDGAFRFVLSGDNTYQGDTVISNGIFQIGDNGTTGSVMGNIETQSVLSFARSDEYTFDGSISGSGELWQEGSGTTILNGNSATHTGSTHIYNGRLLVGGTSANSNAYLTTSVEIEHGGTLGGFGTISGNVTNRGTVAPGASQGTLTILGDYVQEDGGQFVVDIVGSESDHLQVNGSATLGGTISVLVDPTQGFVHGQPYTIITASNGISGRFANVDGMGRFDQNFITGQITIDNDNNRVLIAPGFNQAAFLAAVRTPNQRAVADYLLRTGGTASTQALVSSLVGEAAFQDEMDKLGAASYADEEEQLALTARWFQSQLSDRIDLYVDAEKYQSPRMWVTPYGSSASIDQSDNASGFNTDMGGLAVGAEFPIAHTAKVGFGLAATYFNGNSSGKESVSDNGMLYQAGLYGSYQHDQLTLGASVELGGASNIDSTRTTSDQESMEGNYDATVFSQQFRASYNIDVKGNAHLRPFIGVINQNVNRESFDETGPSTAHTLSVEQQDYNSFKSEIGLATEAALGREVSFVGSIAWQHEFADDEAQMTAQLIGSNADDSYTNSGVELGREFAVVKAGLVLVHKEKLNLTALYEGVFADSYSENGGKLQLDFDLS